MTINRTAAEVIVYRYTRLDNAPLPLLLGFVGWWSSSSR